MFELARTRTQRHVFVRLPHPLSRNGSSRETDCGATNPLSRPATDPPQPRGTVAYSGHHWWQSPIRRRTGRRHVVCSLYRSTGPSPPFSSYQLTTAAHNSMEGTGECRFDRHDQDYFTTRHDSCLPRIICSVPKTPCNFVAMSNVETLGEP